MRKLFLALVQLVKTSYQTGMKITLLDGIPILQVDTGSLSQSTVSHSGSYSARIHVTQVPSNPLVRNAQLKTTDFHIQAGHDYHLSMWLKADRNVDIELILVKNTTPWTWLVAKTISLNTSYQHVDLLETNAPFTTDDDVRLAIRCGNLAKIYVDDIVLTDCTSPSAYKLLSQARERFTRQFEYK